MPSDMTFCHGHVLIFFGIYTAFSLLLVCVGVFICSTESMVFLIQSSRWAVQVVYMRLVVTLSVLICWPHGLTAHTCWPPVITLFSFYLRWACSSMTYAY